MEADLSQKALGIKAGIDQFSASARMNQYETDKHVPDFGTVKRIAKILKVPTASGWKDYLSSLVGCYLMTDLFCWY